MILDTNILIALINRTTSKLPKRLRDGIDARQPHCISVVSIWEIAIKTAKGKLEIALAVDDIGGFLGALGVTILPMTLRHAVGLTYPLPKTKDPFDRILLAICAVEGMKLVTTDEKLEGHPLVY